MFRNVLVCVLVLSPSISALGQNTFTIGGQNLVIGATDEQIPIVVDNAITCYGVSVGLRYDPTVLNVTDIDITDTLAADPAVFFVSGTINEDLGVVSWGAVYGFGFGAAALELPPGQDEVVARLVVDVVATEAGGGYNNPLRLCRSESGGGGESSHLYYVFRCDWSDN